MVEIYARMRAKEAWRLFEESLTLRRELGDEVGIGRTLQKMGLLLVVGQDFERVAKLYGESLALARRAGDKLGIVMTLWLGARSARLWGASEALLDSMSLALGPAERYHYRSYAVAARVSLGDAAWEAHGGSGATAIAVPSGR